jgi:hypothetical protein
VFIFVVEVVIVGAVVNEDKLPEDDESLLLEVVTLLKTKHLSSASYRVTQV